MQVNNFVADVNAAKSKEKQTLVNKKKVKGTHARNNTYDQAV